MIAPRPTPITQKQVTSFLKPRPADSHKGLFGTVTVLGGANGMVGAALLAGRAALQMGAGCVHVGLLGDNAPGVDLMQPELMVHGASEALQRLPHPQSLSQRAREAEPSPPGRGQGEGEVLLIGCGLGQSPAAHKLLYDVLLLDLPLVIDADALNIIAQRPDLRGMLHSRQAPHVITPHPGEAARLLACSTADIQNDRAAATQKLAKKLGGSVVLKGAGSICATADGELHLNPSGNPGMSSAGMGDVLAGMIAAFIAQGLSADRALLLAVYLHGAAGDELVKQQAMLGMSASEVTVWARWLLNRWVAQ